MKIRHILLILYYIITQEVIGFCAINQSYTTFLNNDMQGMAVQINCFDTDNDGQLWCGTANGILYSFDGNISRERTQISGQIYSLLINNEQIFVGTDDAFFMFDIPTGKLKELKALSTIRTIVRIDSLLLLGTYEGIQTYNLINSKFTELTDKHGGKLECQNIYSISKTNDQTILIGTYDGLCSYNIKNKDFTKINIPSYKGKVNRFVNSLLYDEASQCTWVGTEGALLKYYHQTDIAKQEPYAIGNSIKSLAKDKNDNLLIGTDNGLFIVSTEGTENHFVHDSRNTNSLIGNIIWTIYTDEKNQVWIGTDCGISTTSPDNKFIPISEITQSNDGNTFYTMLKDTHNRIWLGGSNGLIKTATNFKDVDWFRFGNINKSLPHNKIRQIFEDSNSNIWIATDGGINRFDEKTKEFIKYNIIDSTGVYNANWAYEIYEDATSHFWIATCQGGVLVVDKNKLQNSDGNYTAEHAITTINGLPNNYIEQIRADKKGNIYVLTHRDGVYRINATTRMATAIQSTIGATALLVTDSDTIIIATDEKIISIFDNNIVEEIHFGNKSSVFALISQGKRVWLSKNDGLWTIENKTLKKVLTSKRHYTALRIVDNIMYAGSVDGILIEPIDELLRHKVSQQTYISAIYINDEIYGNGADIRYIKNIELANEQNSLAIELTDFTYGIDKEQFAYKLNGFDNEWHILANGDYRLQFPRLSYGQYTLLVGKPTENGIRQDNTIDIEIAAPWYFSMIAYIIYIIATVALTICIVYFFDMKQRLKIEHIEKEKTLEQAQLKIDFFTNVSHEFKTPMSLVIGPLGTIINNTTDTAIKRDLTPILRNAKQLNTMINRALSFARIDHKIDDVPNLVPIEIVEFSQSILNIHRETENAKNLSLNFTTTVEKAYANVDAVKMESILNNIISNACKYTNKGSVNVGILTKNDTIEISIADSGIGIPQNELPHVFEKFYRSSKTANRLDSSGIGLYLVKQYVEMFGGKVNVESDGTQGTLFRIILPLINAGIEDASIKNGNNDLARLLIVEDNRQIANYIVNILSKRYNCNVAHNGQMGLELAQKFKPNIIVADIMMPIMDGMEMAHRLKRDITTSNIPIIMLTAKDDKITESESMRNNIDAFMSKPFEIEQLELRIEQILQKQTIIKDKARIEAISSTRPIIAVSNDEKFLTKLVDVVDQHLSDSDFNVNALADIMATSPKQLYRRVKALTNQTPVEYINNIKMQKAAMLLSQGSFTIAEVMYMVGYTNHSYFAKCFAATFNMTPKQYKQKTEKKEAND